MVKISFEIDQHRHCVYCLRKLAATVNGKVKVKANDKDKIFDKVKVEDIRGKRTMLNFRIHNKVFSWRFTN